jgi:hypothetical protein
MTRRLALLSVVTFGLSLAACGDDEKEEASGAAVARFEFSGDRAKLSGPQSVEAGAVRVTFKNSGKDDAGVTVVRIGGDHTPAETVEAGKAWGDQGKPLPEWIRFVGGVSQVGPGGTFSAVQELTAGNYVGVDIGSNEYVPFKVTADGGGEVPSPTATIEAVEYGFATKGLKAGKGQVRFTNSGKEPHFAFAAPIRKGKTIEDVRKALTSEEGPPPIVEEEGVSTGILDGGFSQVIDLELKRGKYALVCFLPDRKGGPPHAFKGMISEGVVN